jgi:hypothetical protein
MLHWSSETAFTPLPPLPTRFGKKTITRGVDLAGAVDWDDFATTRWCLAGADHERPTLTAHALDGLSFPITLAWATQQPAVAAAIHDAKLRGANSAADVRFAAAAAGVDDNATLGDGDLTLPPLTVLIAGASARTEQFLLEHTEYWNEFVVASPVSSGGAHLAFVGPDVDARKIGESAGVERDKNKTVSLEDKKQSSCANSFAYAVLGFEKGKGPEAGLRDDQLYALACRAAERAAGKAWDALGMRR